MYESKKYGKGLKMAQKILKNNPKHAETHSLHALFKFYTSEDKEKYEAEAKSVNFSTFSKTFEKNISALQRALLPIIRSTDAE